MSKKTTVIMPDKSKKSLLARRPRTAWRRRIIILFSFCLLHTQNTLNHKFSYIQPALSVISQDPSNADRASSSWFFGTILLLATRGRAVNLRPRRHLPLLLGTVLLLGGKNREVSVVKTKDNETTTTILSSCLMMLFLFVCWCTIRWYVVRMRTSNWHNKIYSYET